MAVLSTRTKPRPANANVTDNAAIEAVAEVAAKLADVERDDQEHQLISLYQRHWRTRTLLAD